MTVQQKNYIEQNWNKWINASTLTLLIGFIIYQAKFQQRTETSIQEFEKHQQEFKDFVNEVKSVYIPRIEAEKDTKNILNILVEIKEDLNYLKRNNK